MRSLPILLLGNGDSDKDAEVEVAQSLVNTVVSVSELTFIAGESASFILEVRTINNKRKADANPALGSYFAQKDGLNDGEYEASFFRSDLPGTY